MDEWLAIVAWLKAQMLATPGQPSELGSRIYREKAPQGTATPYVIIDSNGSDDYYVLGGTRIMGYWDTMIKVVHEENHSQVLHDIMSWVDTAIQNKMGSETGIQVLGCVRRGNVINYPDQQQFEHLGYQYRIWAQKEP